MFPKARNGELTKKDLATATKLVTLLDVGSLDMNMIGFFVSGVPAEQQLRFIDLINAYVIAAKDSDNPSISMWANSLAP